MKNLIMRKFHIQKMNFINIIIFSAKRKRTEPEVESSPQKKIRVESKMNMSLGESNWNPPKLNIFCIRVSDAPNIT